MHPAHQWGVVTNNQLVMSRSLYLFKLCSGCVAAVVKLLTLSLEKKKAGMNRHYKGIESLRKVVFYISPVTENCFTWKSKVVNAIKEAETRFKKRPNDSS